MACTTQTLWMRPESGVTLLLLILELQCVTEIWKTPRDYGFGSQRTQWSFLFVYSDFSRLMNSNTKYQLRTPTRPFWSPVPAKQSQRWVSLPDYQWSLVNGAKCQVPGQRAWRLLNYICLVVTPALSKPSSFYLHFWWEQWHTLPATSCGTRACPTLWRLLPSLVGSFSSCPYLGVETAGGITGGRSLLSEQRNCWQHRKRRTENCLVLTPRLHYDLGSHYLTGTESKMNVCVYMHVYAHACIHIYSHSCQTYSIFFYWKLLRKHGPRLQEVQSQSHQDQQMLPCPRN